MGTIQQLNIVQLLDRAGILAAFFESKLDGEWRAAWHPITLRYTQRLSTQMMREIFRLQPWNDGN